MQCPRCEGSGQCSECRGQGFVACVNCSGSGQRSSSRGGSYPCRACQASGKLECSPLCSSCEGSGQITTQLQDKVRGKYLVRFDNTLPVATVSHSITALCAVLYLVGAFSPLSSDWMLERFGNLSGLWSEPWRLVTSGFLHFSVVHLFCNLIVLWRFGPALEGLYGSRRFSGLYLITLLGGSLFSSGLNQLLGRAVLSAGASGAMFGLFGCICALYWRYRTVPYELARDLFAWLAVSTLVNVGYGSSVDPWCYLGGFLAGFAYASLTRRPSGGS